MMPLPTINGEQNAYEALMKIDGSKVTTETGIPLMLVANLPGVKNGAGDVRLAKLDGTPIAREIEWHYTATDDVVIHYPFDTISGHDSKFYVYWGNSNLVEPDADSTYGSQAVWDSNFVFVSHLNNDPSGSAPQLIDSTSNNNNGTSEGSMTSGDLVDDTYGKKTQFDTNDAYDIGDSDELDGMSSITVETKVRLNSVTGGAHGIVSKHSGVGSTSAYLMRTVDNNFQFFILNSSDTQNLINVVDILSIDTNYYAVGRWNGSQIQAFLDGDEIGTAVAHTGTMASETETVVIAKYIDSSNSLDGDLGEIRISNISRSDNWIATTHNSLNNPTDVGTAPFYLSVGVREHQRIVPQYI